MIEFGNDLLDEDTLSKVWNEIDLIYDQMVDPNQSGAAIVNGEIVKSGKGFLVRGSISEFVLPVVCSLRHLVKDNQCQNYTLLINCYGDGDYYGEHHDSSEKTFNIILCRDDDNITGGEFVLVDDEITLPCKNNSFVLFDSKMKHKVNKVSLKDKNPKLGRFSLTYFFF